MIDVPVVFGEHGEAVGPDLVSGVAIVGHAVAARHHRRHLARGHERGRHAVRDEGAGEAVLGQS